MSMLVVPTDASGATLYDQTTTFEGSSFNLELAFNQRVQCWYLSVADASGVDICNGVKLIVGLPLLRKCKDPRRPPGELLVISSTGNDSPPGLLDLYPDSGRCTLFYMTSDWVAMLSAMPCSVTGSQVSFTSPQSLPAGTELVFASQPLATYSVVQTTSNSLTANIQPEFTGTEGGTVAQVPPASLFGTAQQTQGVSPLSTYGIE